MGAVGEDKAELTAVLKARKLPAKGKWLPVEPPLCCPRLFFRAAPRRFFQTDLAGTAFVQPFMRSAYICGVRASGVGMGAE